MTDTSEGEIPDLSLELPVFVGVKKRYVLIGAALKGKANTMKK